MFRLSDTLWLSRMRPSISYRVVQKLQKSIKISDNIQRRERPYQHDSTASRLLSEVKHVRAWLVLRWGTTLESQVLFSFLPTTSTLGLFVWPTDPSKIGPNPKTKQKTQDLFTKGAWRGIAWQGKARHVDRERCHRHI